MLLFRLSLQPARERVPAIVRTACAVLSAAFLFHGAAVQAQEVTAPALKAAFLYHLSTFTQWPEEALRGSAAFTMCTLDDPAMREALARTIAGRDYGGRPMAAVNVTVREPLRGCHILYIPSHASDSSARVIESLQEHPALTISDMDGFVRKGGIVQLYVEGGRLRLFVDAASAARARLKFSSRLLALSRKP
jgi:hypothetical protein